MQTQFSHACGFAWLDESRTSAAHICTSQAQGLVQQILEMLSWSANQHAIMLVARAPILTGRQRCASQQRVSAQVTTGARVALRNDSYALHLLLPTKVDPLVSLMKVEKVPDSTYDMIGGLDQQIKEIKEVSSTR